MAQNLIICQFCEISKEIKWKCFSCDLVLCAYCAGKHSKFGGSEEHCIIHLKQVGTPENLDIIQKLNLKNIRCTIHEEEKCSLFCKKCKEPICSFCVLEPEHKGHNLEKLVTVYNNQLSDLKDIKKRIEKNSPGLSKIVSECTYTIDNYNEVKQKILQRQRYIKERATAEAAKLLVELDNFFKPNKEALMEDYKKILEKQSMTKKTNKLIDEALQSHQATYVLKTIGKVDKHLQLKVNADAIPQDQKFMFSIPDSLSINFGSVEVCPNNLRIINTYEICLPGVHGIKKLMSLKKGTLVFFYEKGEEEFMEYCDIHSGRLVFKYKTCIESFIGKEKRKVHDMTVTEDDVILVTSNCGSNSNKILYMNAYDNQFNKFQIYSNFPKFYNLNNGIHSFDQTILIGFHKYNCAFSKDKPAKGVMVLDKKGNCSKTLWITENDSDSLKIGSIDSLTKNINMNIVICDQHSLFVFDSKLKCKWTNKTLTSPNDIVTTPTGLIAVCDINAIHVFSMDGKLLTRIGRTDGIHYPTCLHINKSGQLLVGCEGPTKLEDSKIHVIEIF
ncbi:Hypothetical predicted protein [Mytilus galloprovincialis]|uniref:B box-type domain-containing protein n=1 Tax=Mytilus galloprovincialis TaxID=29158 RepID=A0A8B6CBT1_MYTGA|nr:Hypothetical predicted protein [Mytilus galloprovincialis]